jgi:hypothetical protein
MAYLHYRNYTVLTSCSPAENPGEFIATVSIRWTKDGEQKICLFASPEPCSTTGAAHASALEAAQAWIDDRKEQSEKLR